jgi:hypothetical protein
MARHAHLVGSVSLQNAETVMSTVANLLGDCCTRIPDGETGERGYWIRWQKNSFDNCTGLNLEIISQNVPGFKDTLERPFYNIRDGVDPATLDMGDLGYAREAIASYETFKTLKADGVIGADVRFQVSIPSPMALVIGFVVKEDQLAVEPAIVAALERDLANVQAAIPAADLSIQYDVCQEVVGLDGAAHIPYDNILEGSVQRIGHMCDLVNDGVEVGIHLCYGDPGHKHIVEPKDLGTSVAFANGITNATTRAVNFIHMAVPVDRNDDAYFEPLTNLALAAETRLILGLVHHGDGLNGSKARLQTAEKYVTEFDVATECGFGRRPAETIPELLQIHRDLCD